MPNVLVLQPIRPSNPPALRARADALLERMCAVSPGLEVRQDDTALDIPPHPSVYMRHATVRNYMLDRYLKPEHTHVLWIDSDLIDYPSDLPALLMEVNPSVTGAAIIAPLALLDASPARLVFDPSPERFYDVGGFIEVGRRAAYHPPFFVQDGPLIELDSVGCCYLAPAALYRGGVRYKPPITDYYVEHWSVMQAARKRGYRICALTQVRAIHAWLPDFGLEAN
jgi:hypothetical protein